MHHARTSLSVAMAAALAVGVVAIPPASAQTGANPPSQEQQQFAEDKLKSFAMAALEVQRIAKDYQPQLQSAGTENERQQIREEANVKMMEAVKGNGLSVEQYNQIYTAAQTDPAVATKVERHMQKAE